MKNVELKKTPNFDDKNNCSVQYLFMFDHFKTLLIYNYDFNRYDTRDMKAYIFSELSLHVLNNINVCHFKSGPIYNYENSKRRS